MKLKLTLFALLSLSLNLAMAQSHSKVRCASMEVDQRLRVEYPDYAKNRDAIEQFTQQWVADHPEQLRTVVTIPVVVHVVWHTTSENISDAQVQAQIDQLNQDYAHTNSDAANARDAFEVLAANCDVSFCLAARDPGGNSTNGIVHKNTTKTSFSTNDDIKYSSKGGDDAWDRNSYLNIWTGNLSNGLLGYAQFPGGPSATDGVVVLYSSVGSIVDPGTEPAYDLGRTATHEVGHWLNLFHIWGDDGTGCNGSDQVSDTPNQADETYGCPLPTIRTSCTNGPNGDMYENYMDYTDDACMNMFSQGQKSRMQALFNSGGSRFSLVSSLGCTPPNTSCGTPTGLSASSITNTSATVNWGTVSGATSYNVQYKVSTSSTWTTTTSTTNSKSLTGLTAGTTYNYQIQAVCSSGSSSYSSVGSFTTTGGSTCADILEPNDLKKDAASINVGTDYLALLATSNDDDWYKFSNTSSQKNIKVSLTSVPADYDIQLYNTNGTKVATSQNSGTSDETIKYNTSIVGTYKVKVYGYQGAHSSSDCYDLRVDISSTPWRTSDDGILPSAKTDIFVYPNPARDIFNVAFGSSEQGTVKLNIYNMMGQLMFTEDEVTTEGTNTLKLDVSNFVQGLYVAEIINEGSASRTTFEVER